MQVSGNDLKRWQTENIAPLPLLEEHRLALESNLAVMGCADEQIKRIERRVLAQMRPEQRFQALHTVSGIGNVLALMIALETGDRDRFEAPGHLSSYA